MFFRIKTLIAAAFFAAKDFFTPKRFYAVSVEWNPEDYCLETRAFIVLAASEKEAEKLAFEAAYVDDIANFGADATPEKYATARKRVLAGQVETTLLSEAIRMAKQNATCKVARSCYY
jgi:hypothetical protein